MSANKGCDLSEQMAMMLSLHESIRHKAPKPGTEVLADAAPSEGVQSNMSSRSVT